MQCTCPLGTFPTVADVTCKENFGQIQKAIFCLLSSNGTETTVSADADGIVTALQALIPSKALISPYLEAPEQEAGDARTFGGGNDTPNGVEEYLGMNPSTFTAQMRGIPQSIIAGMKQLICFGEVEDNLGVYLINGSGAIEGISGGTTQAPTLAPIPIRALRISDKIHGGYDEPDRNEISWQFLEDYSDKLIIVAPTSGNALLIKNE